MPNFLVLTGQMCSGKSTVYNYLQENGYATIEMGTYFKSIIDVPNLKREQMIQEISNLMKKKGRAEVINSMLSELTRRPSEKGYVICGVRSELDMQIIIDKLPSPVKLILVYAETNIRYNRCITRGRTNDPTSFKEFYKADLNELNNGIIRLLDNYDFDFIYNNYDQFLLFNQIESLLNTY